MTSCRVVAPVHFARFSTDFGLAAWASSSPSMRSPRVVHQLSKRSEAPSSINPAPRARRKRVGAEELRGELSFPLPRATRWSYTSSRGAMRRASISYTWAGTKARARTRCRAAAPGSNARAEASLLRSLRRAPCHRTVENEELIKYGWPCDIWWHVDKLSSAHVYLRLGKGQTIDDITKEASAIRVHRDASSAPVAPLARGAGRRRPCCLLSPAILPSFFCWQM